MDHAAADSHGGAEHVEKFERARFGMWLFLASEIMFFSGFIGAYIVLRMANPHLADVGQQSLSWQLAAVNTAVLIISSLTMVLAVNAISKGNRGKCEDMIFLTAVLGTLFLVIKGFEYSAKFDHNIFPNTSTFWSAYFLMTGFHGLHVLGGIVALVFLMFYAKHYGPERYTKVENVALYWHFVDLVWIFLFPIVYLL
ncbi:MAG TPA: cytochrome c oxidase subunit 3 family protein [Planctomycetota bacterium]|nr:cytochrome c oxidase subunit 3 family protein [Planctomycetota bacterium]